MLPFIPEYKRDTNENYLILPVSDSENSSSYPFQMLLTNHVPGLLHCRLDNIDGHQRVCYEITSRQPLSSLWENRQICFNDLAFLFEHILQILETMSDYLLNPSLLFLQPEFIYSDALFQQLAFCFFPGWETPIQEQLQTLVEYLLPKINHKDPDAVMFGYAVYRHTLEDTFRIDSLKAELYKTRETKEKKLKVKDQPPQYQNIVFPFTESAPPSADIPQIHERPLSKEDSSKDVSSFEEEYKNTASMTLAAIIMPMAAGISLLLALAYAKNMGYLPWLSVEAMTGCGIFILSISIVFTIYTARKKKQHPSMKNFPERSKPKPELSADHTTFMSYGNQSSVLMEGKNDQVIHTSAENSSALPRFTIYESESEPKRQGQEQDYMGETVALSSLSRKGVSSLVSREPGELPVIHLTNELTIIGKMENAADAVIPLPTVSRIHAKIRQTDEGFLLTDLNSRNGTMVNGRLLEAEEDYLLKDQDEVDFASARYIFIQ